MSYAPPPPPYEGGGHTPAQSNQKAMWSMILGILSIVACGILAGLPALILGSSARKEIEASGGAQTGAGMAKAGVILGWISVVLTILFVLLVVAGVFAFNVSP